VEHLFISQPSVFQQDQLTLAICFRQNIVKLSFFHAPDFPRGKSVAAEH